MASWGNSLRAMAQVVQYAKLNDHGVIVEYELPSSSRRLDFMICGRNVSHRDEAVIVELKQWSESNPPTRKGWSVPGSEGKIGRSRTRRSKSVSTSSIWLTRTLRSMKATAQSSSAPVHICITTRFESNDVLVAPKFSDTLARYPYSVQTRSMD